MSRWIHRPQTLTPTLSDALERYQAEISPRKKGAATDASIAKRWLATRLATRRLSSITDTEISSIAAEWLQTLAPATVVRRLALLSHLYTVARKTWKHRQLANPVQFVDRPAVNNARERRLYDNIRLRGVPAAECPRSEIEWLIRATRSAELPTIMVLAAESGMRRSELVVAARRERIDLTHGVVHLDDTKNGERRAVPLTPWALAWLKLYLVGKPSRGRIFSISPSAATRAFARARDRARRQYEALCRRYGRAPRPEYFVDLRLHDLRHEATTRLAEVYDMHKLAKVTGHRDTRMLLRYYHPSGRDLARELARSDLGRRQRAQLSAGITPALLAQRAHSS
ncbi:shufflon-specific DNA recombinase [Bordetella ansorpii]|uniref:Shufflon-specific DNA recombinase n=1 Tax=Bordetella ansorpii TaxID=288768 RepID=A0A157SVR5_9BORD|nr:integrase [Bordetella ansorpii]SAI74550.1 shufflon-specific DNA recombinase [Bordetella ansorpii]